MKSNITFGVLAYNEEKRLPYVIKNLNKYGEIIILDGGSTDRTKEIAESMGATFYSRPENQKPYVESKENFDFLKSVAHTEWLYWGYTDNILPKKLLEKMKELSEQKEPIASKWINAPLYTYLWGNTKNFIQKSYIPVLFHRDFVDFSNERIHSMGDFTGIPSEILNLPNETEYAVKHFSVYDMHKFVLGHLKYAETEADQKFASGKRYSTSRMIAGMLRYMWIYGKEGYKSGVQGFQTILLYAFFRLMAYMRLYELEHGITMDKVNENYNILKEEMMKEFD